MDILSENPRLKRRRTSKPKSKTGCLTCRKRRVKCDEVKPICIRCSRSGYECDGYVKKDAPIRKQALRFKILQPIVPKAGTPKIQIYNLPFLGNVSNENETERRYVSHFLKKTTTGFEGMMDWTLWNHVLMQFSHHQPFVRDAIVAIGAILKSLEASADIRDRQAHHTNVVEMAKLHREFALLKYTKAVKNMRAALNDSEPRQTLIACLLIFCFELLLRNVPPAIGHFISGQRLLRSWQKQELGTKEKPVPFASLEDEICEAFAHLDLQISTIVDHRPLEFHKDVLVEERDAIKNMPSTFHDLNEAKKYLNIIMSRSHHFLATTWEATESAALRRDFEIKAQDAIPVTTGFNIFTTTNIVPSWLPTQQKPYVEDLERWLQAFNPHFQSTCSPATAGLRNFRMATLMQIHGIATRISIAGLLFTSECSYDVFLPQFREILDLTLIIIDAYHKKDSKSSPGDNTFSLDLGIIPPLFLLLTRCRDGVMRRHAIAILKKWHVELCWTPRLIAEIGTFVMEVEEEGLLGKVEVGMVKEGKRAIISGICEEPGGLRHNVAVIQLCLRRGGEGGGPVWREKRVVYGSDGEFG